MNVIGSRKSVAPDPWSRTDWMACGALTVLSFLLLWIHRHPAIDDAFITFRYSYNLAAGHGFVYNIGEHFLGTSGPLYAFVLGLLAIPKPDAVPNIAWFLSFAAYAACTTGIYTVFRRDLARYGGFAAAFSFFVWPLPVATLGMELLPQFALIIWGAWAVRSDRGVLAAVLASLAIAVRPDAAPSAAVLLVALWIIRRSFPLREAIVSAGILAPLAIAGTLYFGSPLPQTAAAKMAQTVIGWKPYTSNALADWLSGPFMDYQRLQTSLLAHELCIFGFGGLALLAIVARRRTPTAVLLLAAIAAHEAAYFAAGLPFYKWYMVTLCGGGSVVVGMGMQRIRDKVGSLWLLAWTFVLGYGFGTAAAVEIVAWVPFPPPWLPHALALAMAVGVVFVARRVSSGKEGHRHLLLAASTLTAIGIGASAFRQHEGASYYFASDARMLAYEDVGDWLSRNTSPSASVGYVEIGVIGYYGHRRMVDPLGLVNRGFLQNVERHRAWLNVQNERPDYIIVNHEFDGLYLHRVIEATWFKQGYRPVCVVRRGAMSPLWIMHKVRDIQPPPPPPYFGGD